MVTAIVWFEYLLNPWNKSLVPKSSMWVDTGFSVREDIEATGMSLYLLVELRKYIPHIRIDNKTDLRVLTSVNGHRTRKYISKYW